jgi:decaprenyl-phosphate phosphoribosyltransferase
MVRKAYNIFRLLRPRQWVKNFAIFAAVTFTGELFNPVAVSPVILGFFVFCAVSSASYIINDIFDIKSDRMHPFKKFRPLAHGDVGVRFAAALAIALILFSVTISTMINTTFFLFIIVYILLQIFYSSLLKTITVIDILAIASGYILRVLGGEIASGFHISVWLLLTTISISLFLAIGKRRSELTLVSANKDTHIAATRKTLSHYSERLLDVYASIFATSTFIAYSLFTFLENPRGIHLAIGEIVLSDLLPSFFQRKWLMLTIIPVVYGLMRYLQDIYEKHEGESPEKVLFSDKPLLATVIVWALMVIVIIYFITP